MGIWIQPFPVCHDFYVNRKRIQRLASEILAFNCIVMHVELCKHIDGIHIYVDFAVFS